MKKRTYLIVALLLALSICLSLSACGTAGSAPRENAGQNTSGKNEADAATSADSKQQQTEDAKEAQEPEKRPEPKLLHQITEQKDGTIKSWTDRYYDGNLLLSSEEIMTGMTTRYDEKGRMRTVTTGMGAVVEEARYDEQDNLVYFMPQSSTVFTIYDHQGNQICRSAQNGAMAEEYAYDEQGRVIASRFLTESLGNIEISFTYEYSPDGLHMDAIRCCNGSLGNTTYDHETRTFFEFDYDGLGHIIREVDHTSTKFDMITSWAYDNGKLVEKVDESNGSVSKQTWEYDGNGNLIARADISSSGSWYYRYVLNDAGKTVETYSKSVAADGTETEWLSQITEYNSHGDRARSFSYYSSAASRDDWNSVTYYIYDYDNIDPHRDGSFRVNGPQETK